MTTETIKNFTRQTASENEEDLPWMDERYLPRWHTKKRITYITDHGQAYRTITHDISAEGVSLIVHPHARLGQNVMVSISLNKRSSIDAKGQIVWKKDLKSRCLAGISLKGMSPQDQIALLNKAFLIEDDIIETQ